MVPGRVSVQISPPGRAAVYAYAEGYAPRFGVLNVETGKVLETRLDMMLEAVAGGRVVDAAGEPVVGARVRLGYDVFVEGADILAGMVRGVAGGDRVVRFQTGRHWPFVSLWRVRVRG